MNGFLKAWLWVLGISVAIVVAAVQVGSIPSDACGYFTCTEGYAIDMILGAMGLLVVGTVIIVFSVFTGHGASRSSRA